MSNTRPWFLYLIECADGSLYTGITINVAARYEAHCNGTGARYTRSHPPRQLLGAEAYADRSAASKAEYRVKQLSHTDKWQLAKRLAAVASESPQIKACLKNDHSRASSSKPCAT